MQDDCSSHSSDNEGCDSDDHNIAWFSSDDDDASQWSELDSDDESATSSDEDECEEMDRFCEEAPNLSTWSDDTPVVQYGYDNPLSMAAEQDKYKINLRKITTLLRERLKCYMNKATSAGIAANFPALLQLWRQNNRREHQDKYIYILDHRYALQSLRSDRLKDADKSLVEALHETCSRNGYQVFLGQMERTQTSEWGSKYDQWNEVDGFKATLTLESIVTPEGIKVASSCGTSLKEILQDCPFDGTPTSEKDVPKYEYDYERYVSLITKKYSRSVAIIVPVENLNAILVPACPSSEDDDDEDEPHQNVASLASSFPENFLRVLCAREAKDRDQVLRSVVFRTIEWGITAGIPCGHQFYDVAAEWCLANGMNNLLRRVMDASITSTGIGARQMMYTVAKHLKSIATGAVKWHHSFGHLLSIIWSLRMLQRLFLWFENRLACSEQQKSFNKWATSVIDRKLLSKTRFVPGHCSMILRFTRTRNSDWSLTVLLPLLSSSKETEFIQPLLARLYKLRSKPQIDPIVVEYFRHFMRNNPSAFFLKVDDFAPDKSARIAAFLDFIKTSLELNLREELGFVMRENADMIAQDKESVLHMPNTLQFVADFISLTSGSDECREHATGRELVRNLLRRMVKRYCNTRPKRPENLKRVVTGCLCPCRDCQRIISFLENPDAGVAHPQVTMDRMRDHVFANGIDSRHFIMTFKQSSRFPADAQPELTKTNFEYELQCKKYKKKYEIMCELWKPIQCPHLEYLLGNEYPDLGLLRGLEAMWDKHLKSVEPLNRDSARQARVQGQSPVHQLSGSKRKEPVVDRELEEAARLSPARKKVWRARIIGKHDRGNNHI
ncbi:hypothetical protein FKW77_008626 [Venturia effusa]|uniref:Uncharacterized protein n=1 Tax=Venturia effusa TaxID=50376 RepID=A0A517LCQ9_9PEZI|nr:hypothetical protein FKW77_008626 [Venturia effusa]